MKLTSTKYTQKVMNRTHPPADQSEFIHLACHQAGIQQIHQMADTVNADLIIKISKSLKICFVNYSNRENNKKTIF